MARYIDADKLIAWCMETFQVQSAVAGKAYADAFLTAVLSCQTADVAKKSETATEILDELDGFIKQIRVYDFINMPITYYSRIIEFIDELRTKYTEGKG